MHRVVSSGLLTDSPAEGLFSLDAVVRRVFALPRKALALYHDELVWEALWQATLQTYQGVRRVAKEAGHAAQARGMTGLVRARRAGAPFAAAAAPRQRRSGASGRGLAQAAARAPWRQAGASATRVPDADTDKCERH